MKVKAYEDKKNKEGEFNEEIIPVKKSHINYLLKKIDDMLDKIKQNKE